MSAFASASFLYNSLGSGTGPATIGCPSSGSNSITAVPALPHSASRCALSILPRGINNFTFVELLACATIRLRILFIYSCSPFTSLTSDNGNGLRLKPFINGTIGYSSIGKITLNNSVSPALTICFICVSSTSLTIIPLSSISVSFVKMSIVEVLLGTEPSCSSPAIGTGCPVI